MVHSPVHGPVQSSPQSMFYTVPEQNLSVVSVFKIRLNAKELTSGLVYSGSIIAMSNDP